MHYETQIPIKNNFKKKLVNWLKICEKSINKDSPTLINTNFIRKDKKERE